MMKQRLYKARYFYIREALKYQKSVYIGGEKFFRAQDWKDISSFDFYYALIKIINENTQSHYSITFDFYDPFVLKVTQYYFFTDEDFTDIIKDTDRLAKSGGFKEIWIKFGEENLEVIESHSKLFIKGTLFKLKEYNLPNLRLEDNIIKWDIEDET